MAQTRTNQQACEEINWKQGQVSLMRNLSSLELL
jgi:hypothetical protein